MSRRSMMTVSVFTCLLTFPGPLAAAENAADRARERALEADRAYRKSLEIHRPPRDPMAQYEQAMRVVHDMNIQQATAAIQKDSSDAAAYARRADAYYAKRENAAALKDYNQSLELDPKQGKLYAKRATLHYLLQDYDKSWEDVQKAESMGESIYADFRKALEEARTKPKNRKKG